MARPNQSVALATATPASVRPEIDPAAFAAVAALVSNACDLASVIDGIVTGTDENNAQAAKKALRHLQALSRVLVGELATLDGLVPDLDAFLATVGVQS